MALIGILTRFFGGDGDEQQSGVDALKQALREPRKDITLTAEFGEPHLDTRGANTAVFPVHTYDSRTGEHYRDTQVEFAIESDEGRDQLDIFLRNNDIDGVDNIEAVEGTEASAWFDADGNITVGW
jgi:hypothetical protein